MENQINNLKPKEVVQGEDLPVVKENNLVACLFCKNEAVGYTEAGQPSCGECITPVATRIEYAPGAKYPPQAETSSVN